ncbi:serine kinase [Pokkaliibacter sp. CJK22405]|uniref:serine kinase n=1 Tax=Pokkaliibacter sp. CJK22405 TaxID=3384615 RepID=UPI0039847A75
MASVDAIQRRLDTQFDRSQKNMDDLVTNLDGASLDDIYAFNSAMRQNANASWAVNQEVTVKHNLAKAILNGIN